MAGINMTRQMKKIELPRPLKISNTGSVQTRNSILDIKINTVDDLVILTETVACQISQGSYNRILQSNIASMYLHLKVHGAQLETTYKDSLNRSFAVFRNGCQDEKLDKRSRLHLLELVELRANQWQVSDTINHYYNYMNESPYLPVSNVVALNNEIIPQQTTVPEIPNILGPGEIIKASGKFSKPTKIPGKNYSKDEVVIRNADSGKVSPGAKERLVQITGPNEENVNHAKHLIGDTIRRNASPVRLSQSGSGLISASGPGFRGSASSLNSSTSDESPHPTGVRDTSASSQRVLLHSLSTNDAALREYRYTVTCGDHSLKITGTNPDIVRTAKLVLDEFFSRGGIEQPTEGSGDFFTLSRSLTSQDLFSGSVGTHGLNHPEVFNGVADDDVFVESRDSEENANETTLRRARFSRTVSEKKEGDESKIRYTYETILQYAESPLSKKTPVLLSKFPPDVQRKVMKAESPEFVPLQLANSAHPIPNISSRWRSTVPWPPNHNQCDIENYRYPQNELFHLFQQHNQQF